MCVVLSDEQVIDDTLREKTRGACVMKVVFTLLFCSLYLLGCSHPIEIVGEGDVLSASGDRDCLLEEEAAGLANCSRNWVVGDYYETYYAAPRSDWQFHRWGSYCTTNTTGKCSFAVREVVVERQYGKTMPPLVAIFRKTVNTGLNTLFMGHSFFEPYAASMPAHAARAGFGDHTQTRFFSDGASGAPLALWENASKRASIQAVLDGGDVELFGMTFHPDYPSIEGYTNWVDYALEKNPDTRFFIALAWLTSPANFDSITYDGIWHAYHPAIAHAFIDTLRTKYPGVDFYCIPYGQAAAELYTLFDVGNLPDVDTLVSSSLDAVFLDSYGHPDDILVALGELVWLSAIYGVDLSTYDFDSGYTADLKVIARAIMDDHDQNYNAP